jgi:hypothetical protein
VKRDLIERTLLPFFGLGEPENATLGIQRGALSAHLLLRAYLHEPVHDPHSCVKPTYKRSLAEIDRACLNQPWRNQQSTAHAAPGRTAAQHEQVLKAKSFRQRRT